MSIRKYIAYLKTIETGSSYPGCHATWIHTICKLAG